ncbi:uncharacterized protein LOC103270219 [Carlito syrichta]|uniref:Uncharacterized protein LOC103270219 n=1 Tax=Carlito syrichta TaxID=1868482 RepID=A0A3Q0EC12_CARSF|nr:uncharacterized protein LOC103270219 [Carlito syrichta]
MLCSLLAPLLGTFLGVGAQTIHQWPATMVQLVGSPFSLECIVKGTSSPNLYWYRQSAGGSLQLLFYSISADQIDSEVPQNLSASRPQDGQFILSSKKLLLSDSGFYLCAWSIILSWVGQTSVQKLHPLLNLTTLTRSPHLREGWRIFVIGFLTDTCWCILRRAFVHMWLKKVEYTCDRMRLALDLVPGGEPGNRCQGFRCHLLTMGLRGQCCLLIPSDSL